MLTLFIDETCEELTATSDTDLIDFLQGGLQTMNDICGYEVTTSYNCCPLNLIKVAPVYNLNVIYGNVGLNPGDPTTLFITGINSTVVTNASQIVLERLVGLNYGVEVFTIDPTITNIKLVTNGLYDVTPTSWRLTITNNCGHIYVLTFVSGTDSGGSVTSLVITYPSVPTGLSFTGSTLNLTPEVFGLTAFTDGIYTLTISEFDEDGATIVEDHTLFIDCSTTCQVQLLALKCEDPIHLFRWQALTYNNTCRVLTMQQACDLYQLLDSAISSICKKPTNCKPCKSCNK